MVPAAPASLPLSPPPPSPPPPQPPPPATPLFSVCPRMSTVCFCCKCRIIKLQMLAGVHLNDCTQCRAGLVLCACVRRIRHIFAAVRMHVHERLGHGRHAAALCILSVVQHACQRQRDDRLFSECAALPAHHTARNSAEDPLNHAVVSFCAGPQPPSHDNTPAYRSGRTHSHHKQ